MNHEVATTATGSAEEIYPAPQLCLFNGEMSLCNEKVLGCTCPFTSPLFKKGASSWRVSGQGKVTTPWTAEVQDHLLESQLVVLSHSTLGNGAQHKSSVNLYCLKIPNYRQVVTNTREIWHWWVSIKIGIINPDFIFKNPLNGIKMT